MAHAPSVLEAGWAAWYDRDRASPDRRGGGRRSARARDGHLCRLRAPGVACRVTGVERRRRRPGHGERPPG